MEYRRFEVTTQSGRTKYVEIYNGYLEQLELHADILVCSAFQKNYRPTRRTLIGCLDENFGISVSKLAENPELNLRDLGVWISQPLPEKPFGRVACVEMKQLYGEQRRMQREGRSVWPPDVQSLFDTLFFAIQKGSGRGIKAGTVAMPLLGTGNQRMHVKEIASVLAAECIHALNTNEKLEKIIIFERQSEKYASVCKHFRERLTDAQPVSVFISYSHRDAERANAIAASLEQTGIKVWIDHRKIRNPDYAEEIVRAIQKSDVFLILVSAGSQESVNVRRELYNAAQYEEQKLLYIHPVLLDQTPYCETFSYYLQGHDFTDLSGAPTEQKIDGLCQKVRQAALKKQEQKRNQEGK